MLGIDIFFFGSLAGYLGSGMTGCERVDGFQIN